MIELFSDLRLDSTEFCRIEFFILRLALREKVILDLRLCSRWPHGDSSRACGIFEFENRHLLFGGKVAFDIFDHVRLEIFDPDHSGSEHFEEWLCAVRFGEA